MENSLKLEIDSFLHSYLENPNGIECDLSPLIPILYLTFVDKGVLTKEENKYVYNYCFRRANYLVNKNLKGVIEAFKEYDDDELRKILWTALSRRYSSISDSMSDISGEIVSQLVYKLLKFEPDDIFRDLGSGLGTVLLTIYAESHREGKLVEHLYGEEISHESEVLSQAVFSILIGPRSVFDWRITGNNIMSSNGFSCTKSYVYIQPNRDMFRSGSIASRMYPKVSFDNYLQMQWAYIDAMLSKLMWGKNVRAVALVNATTLLQLKYNDYAQHLVDDGWIEGIIELPNVVPQVMTPQYLVVFSKGNEKTKMLTMLRDGFLQNNETKSPYKDIVDVDYVMKSYDNPENEICKVVTKEQLKSLNTWIPSRVPFLALSRNEDLYAPLCSFAEIRMGCQYTTASFNKSDNPTGYRILTSSDIEGGIIEWDKLPYVDINKSLFDKYLIHKGDVIVTTKSSKVKTAVVDIEPTDKVILTGGMLNIEPDTDKLNPTYLKMFLDSEEGVEALKSVQTGSVIMSLSTQQFKNIGIPIVDIETQNKKAAKYNNKLSSIAAHRDQIKKLEGELKYIISEDEE